MSNQPSTNTYNFRPAMSDLVMEAYSRCQIRGSSLTAQHMFDARMSTQLQLAEWSTKPNTPNLFEVKLLSVPLVQGQPTYSVPQGVVAILDYYLRTFNPQAAINITPSFTTGAGSNVVTLTVPGNQLAPIQQVNVLTPVGVGGIVVQGGYQVQSVLSPNQFTIQQPMGWANTTITNGGVLPLFTTANGSPVVSVTLANHGLLPGQIFGVQASTTVGGLTLFGGYQVLGVTSANVFSINGRSNATSAATATENGGQAQIIIDSLNDQPQDLIVLPISRTEYAAQPNKLTQSRPTSVWWDRQPAYGGTSLTVWPTPDNVSSYVFYYYAMTQIQDAQLHGGATLDIPYRFLDAFAAGLAARLARKYAPAIVGDLRTEAQMAWDGASQQDSENVPLYIAPGLSAYLG